MTSTTIFIDAWPTIIRIGAFDDAWWAGFLPVSAWMASHSSGGSAFLTSRVQERILGTGAGCGRSPWNRISAKTSLVSSGPVSAFPALVE